MAPLKCIPSDLATGNLYKVTLVPRSQDSSPGSDPFLGQHETEARASANPIQPEKSWVVSPPLLDQGQDCQTDQLRGLVP